MRLIATSVPTGPTRAAYDQSTTVLLGTKSHSVLVVGSLCVCKRYVTTNSLLCNSTGGRSPTTGLPNHRHGSDHVYQLEPYFNLFQQGDQRNLQSNKSRWKWTQHDPWTAQAVMNEKEAVLDQELAALKVQLPSDPPQPEPSGTKAKKKKNGPSPGDSAVYAKETSYIASTENRPRKGVHGRSRSTIA